MLWINPDWDPPTQRFCPPDTQGFTIHTYASPSHYEFGNVSWPSTRDEQPLRKTTHTHSPSSFQFLSFFDTLNFPPCYFANYKHPTTEMCTSWFPSLRILGQRLFLLFCFSLSKSGPLEIKPCPSEVLAATGPAMKSLQLLAGFARSSLRISLGNLRSGASIIICTPGSSHPNTSVSHLELQCLQEIPAAPARPYPCWNCRFPERMPHSCPHLPSA